MAPQDPLILGEIRGAFGIKGWVRVRSHCRPEDGIFDYDRWWIRVGPAPSADWAQHGVLQWQTDRDGYAVRLSGVESRDLALSLQGATIAVPRAAVKPPASGSYLWHDLLGLVVVNLTGECLGEVVGLIETGASDLLEIRHQGSGRTRLVPFVPGRFIVEVDMPGGQMRVDWHADD